MFLKTLITIIIIFLPWAFGTVEAWSIGIALGGVGLALILTWIMSPRESFQSAKFLFLYWVILLVLFGGYCLFPIQLDIFSIGQPDFYQKPYSFLPASLSPSLSLNMLLLWAGWGGIVWLVAFHFRGRESLKVLLTILIVNAVLLSVIALAQRLTGTHKIFWIRPISFLKYDDQIAIFTGPFVNRNHFAIYINLIWPMVFPLYYLLSKRYHRNLVKKNDALILIGLILAVIFAGLFISSSRGGFLTAGVMGIISIFLFSKTFFNLPRYYWLAGVLLVIVTFFLFGKSMLERLFDSFTSPAESVVHDGRWLIWKDCLPAFEINPFFGWGSGCFQIIYAFYKDPVNIYKVEYAHNDYLQALIETGIMGLSFWLICIGLIYYFLISRLMRLQSRFRKVFLKAIILSLTGMFIHAFYDFPFQMGGLSLTFAALLGLGFAASKENS